MQQPKAVSKPNVYWVCGGLAVIVYVTSCDLTAALVLNTQHRYFALSMLSGHRLQICTPWSIMNIMNQIHDYTVKYRDRAIRLKTLLFWKHSDSVGGTMAAAVTSHHPSHTANGCFFSCSMLEYLIFNTAAELLMSPIKWILTSG